MLVRRLDRDEFVRAQGMLVRPLFPWPGVFDSPFGSGWGIVEPGTTCAAHHHHDVETYVVVRGSGRLRVGDETVAVGPGDVVTLPPLSDHSLENTSQDEDLLYLTVFWQDMDQLAEALAAGAAERAGAAEGLNVLAFGSPPTPNGDLHLGHLAGPYLGADAYVRYMRMRGADAHGVGGLDEHQAFVLRAAEQEGVAPEVVADRFAGEIERSLEVARVDVGVFCRPSTSRQVERLVTPFFRKLHDEGAVVPKTVDNPFCPRCRVHRFDADAAGRCPRCGAAAVTAAGESCGLPFPPARLLDAVCTACGTRTENRPTERLVFVLGRYGDVLADYWARTHLPPRLKAFCLTVLEEGLDDVPVSAPGGWGVPVPVPGFEEHRLASYFSAGIPWYLGSTQQLIDERGLEREVDDFWSPSGTGKVVQFFGPDNMYLHAVVFPAMYAAFDPALSPPHAFVVNEFYRLDDDKFSTSRNHAVWGRDLIARSSPDAVRFHLALTRPEGEQTSFGLADFDATVSAVLAGEWDAWLGELDERVARELGGEAPDAGLWTGADRELATILAHLVAEASAGYEAESFSLRRVARSLCTLVREARSYGRDASALEDVKAAWNERRTSLALELLAAKTLALLAWPLMPDFALRLWRALGYEEPERSPAWEERPAGVPPGQRVEGLRAASAAPPSLAPA